MTRPSSCLATLLALTLFSCHQPAGVGGMATNAGSGIPSQLASNMQGTYYGHYSKGLLTLVINYISGNIASGYDLHKGLRRNLNGEVKQNGNRLDFVLKEPGGNPYDGTFIFSLDTLTLKIAGKWVPSDSTKAYSGPLDLLRKVETEGDELYDWVGDLGDLSFANDGTCTLQYYPSKEDNSQLKTVRGNYERIGDTVRIDWQRNDRTPVLKMRLVKMEPVDGTDSTQGKPWRLEGSGVVFNERPG